MLKVAILGASGYTGVELLRLLAQHPHVKIIAATSERSAGKLVSEVFPNLKSHPRLSLRFEPLKIKKLQNKADLFFLCLPHRTSQETVAYLHKSGKKVIDLSADFRLKDKKTYEKWYESRHMFPDLLKKAVYGLPELYREKIKNADIIANPGCYPASAILGLAPVMGKNFINSETIIIDSKSGVSGAGRNPSQAFMFSEVNESIKAYAVTTHRHTPEIEQELSQIAGSKKKIRIIFTPHLVPMNRGILSAIYVRLKRQMDIAGIQKLYKDFYINEPFIRVLENGALPSTKAVKGSNFCDISVFMDKRNPKTQTLIILSAIDNLLKGASGQAVQNMNIMYGFEETTGLSAVPVFP